MKKILMILLTLIIVIGGNLMAQNYKPSNHKIANTAVTYVNQEMGSCKVFVQAVMGEVGYPLGTGYTACYTNIGYEITAEEATRGDFIQISCTENPNYVGENATSVHTAIVLENLGNGNFNSVESNWNGDNTVGLHLNWNPANRAASLAEPENGYTFEAHYYRLGTIAGYYEDGWHENVISQAFYNKYREVNSTDGHLLGRAWDNDEGTEFVHDLNGMLIQDFNDFRDQTNHDNGYNHPYTAIIHYDDPWMSREPHLLKEGFWSTWMNDINGYPGWALFGPPVTDEYPNSGRTWQTFRRFGPNYANNYNDYKQFYFCWDAGTEILDILDQNYQPVDFSELTVIFEGSANISTDTVLDNFPVLTQSNKSNGLEKSAGNNPSGSAFEVETNIKVNSQMSTATSSDPDGVYHSGLPVSDFDQAFKLVDGDSYDGFYVVVNGGVIPIDDFTMNGNSTIYIGDAPSEANIQFSHWNISPNPGTVNDQIQIRATAYNVGGLPITLSELRLELLDPNGGEAYRFSKYNVLFNPGGGWIYTIYPRPYMSGNHTARFRGLYNGVWQTYAIQTIYINDAPPNADYTAGPISGTAPLNVQFTDKSSGDPTSWLWNFGDGYTSTIQNPSHTYTVAGNYTFSLTVYNNVGSDTRTNSGPIVVTDVPPVSSFNASPIFGTAPLVVQFTDRSSYNITSWLWDFGDSQTSTEQNPSHIYTIPGNYIVSLIVNNSGGIDTSFSSNLIVVVDPNQLAAYFSTDTVFGSYPFTVQFTDQSIGNLMSWLWDFGDGDTSIEQNPSHTYNTVGQHTVSLTVSDGIISDTEIKPSCVVVFYPVIADFSYTFGPGPEPDFAPALVNFLDLSSYESRVVLWDFGDGTTSTESAFASHVYNEPGDYSVTLISGAHGILDSITKIIHIREHVIPDFTVDTTIGPAALTVQFTDLSEGNPTYWVWDFGDSTTSTDQNPTHVYIDSGIYSVRLDIYNHDDSAFISKSDYITVTEAPEALNAIFLADLTIGITPLTVQFTDLSEGNPTSWLWDFGDSTTSTEQSPMHIYTTSGVYSVRLDVGSGQGSNFITKIDYIDVRDSLIVEFSSDITNGPASLTVQFTDQSTGGPTAWMWDFGDGNMSYDQNPIHIYTSVGTYDVSLAVVSDVASKFILKAAYITVNNSLSANFIPLLKFGRSPMTIQFTDQSTANPISWLWEFGDGGISIEQNPSHRYVGGGMYTVSLTVSDGNISDTKVVDSCIRVSLYNFKEDPKIVDLNANHPNPFNPTTTISYSLPKTQQVSLVVYNILGRVVTTLVDGVKESGHHTVTWDSKDDQGHEVSSGMYFYRLSTTDKSMVRKMLLLK